MIAYDSWRYDTSLTTHRLVVIKLLQLQPTPKRRSACRNWLAILQTLVYSSELELALEPHEINVIPTIEKIEQSWSLDWRRDQFVV